MPSRPRPLTRRCPVCGMVMQARKSRENLRDFDTFACLSCDTTIVEAPARPPSERTGKK